MHEASAVGGRQGTADLGDDGDALVPAEAADVDEVFAQGDALDVFHGEVEAAAGGAVVDDAEVVDDDDVGVLQSASRSKRFWATGSLASPRMTLRATRRPKGSWVAS